MTIGLIWATAAGRAAADRLAAAWPGECTVHQGRVRDQLARAWAESDAIVAFLATGATVRLLAPHLTPDPQPASEPRIAPSAAPAPEPQFHRNCSLNALESCTFPAPF